MTYDKIDEILSSRRVEFLGIPINLLNTAETLAIAEKAILERHCIQQVCVNVAKIVALHSNEELRRSVVESNIISADGMGVVWGARLLGLAVPCRVTGIDLMEALLIICERRGFRPYFLGARQEVIEAALAQLRLRHPCLQIAGWRNGYFTPAEEPAIVAAIRESGADCLFVGISSPIKERFIRCYRDQLGVPFLMGVGGSFEVLAGRVARAPRWIQTAGLEWFYRMVQEPRRLWRRYLFSNLRYIQLLWKEYQLRRRHTRAGQSR